MMSLILFPTLVFYAAVILCLVMVARGKWPRWALIVAALPFLHWAVTFAYARFYFSHPDTLISNLTFRPPPSVIPDTLVVLDERGVMGDVGITMLAGRTPIKAIIYSARGCDLDPQDLKARAGLNGLPEAVPTIPPQYLLLKVGRCARSDLPMEFAQTNGIYKELHAIGPSEDILLNAYYRRQIDDPIFPPSVLIYNWFSNFWRDVKSEPDSDPNEFILRGIGKPTAKSR